MRSDSSLSLPHAAVVNNALLGMELTHEALASKNRITTILGSLLADRGKQHGEVRPGGYEVGEIFWELCFGCLMYSQSQV